MVPEGRDPSESWSRIDAAFQDALEQAAGEREHWVRSQYDDEPELRDAVLELLALDGTSADLFDAALRERDAIAAAAAESAEGIDLAGTMLGPYRIEALIATGGMGAVYRAERDDGEFRQRVAIKILPGWATDENTVARLRAERQILSALQHPNITHLLDGGQTGDGYPYLVTEFIDGLPITEYAAREKLDLAERLKLFLAVVDAVQYAHEQGVIHRDIKPANILVDERGHPHLLDFGIAKLKEGALDPVTGLRTATGFSPMTPEYASPEQLASDAVGITSDVYQLGLLLYELVSGVRARRGNSGDAGGITRPSTAVLHDGRAASEQAGLDPERLARELKGDVDTIILKALRPEPEARYRSAQALARDLRHHRAGEAIEAKPESLWSASRRLARQYPVGAGLAAALVAVLVIWAASLSFYARELEQQRDEAERQATRATQSKNVLIDMFRRTDTLQSDAVAGKDAQVWEMLDAAAEEARITLADDPEVLAELLATLVTLQDYAGEPDRALALLEESVVLYDGLGEGFEAEAAMQKAELMKRLVDLDRARADALRTEVEAGMPALIRSAPLAAVTVLIDMGVSDDMDGNYTAALTVFDQARAILDVSEVEDWSSYIEVQFGRGNALTDLERFDEATAALEEALALTHEHFGENHDRLTGTLSALAALEGLKGNEAQSIAWAEQLVELMGRDSEPTYSGLLAAKNNLALAYGRAGRYEEERAMLLDIIEVKRGITGESGDRALGINIKNLASNYYRTSDYSEARAAVLEARDMMARHYPSDSVILATSWYTLGLVELDDGSVSEAEVAFRRTLEIIEPALGEDHLQVHLTRCYLGETRRRQGDMPGAKALAEPALLRLREKGTDYYRAYIDRCEAFNAALNPVTPSVSGS